MNARRIAVAAVLFLLLLVGGIWFAAQDVGGPVADSPEVASAPEAPPAPRRPRVRAEPDASAPPAAPAPPPASPASEPTAPPPLPAQRPPTSGRLPVILVRAIEPRRAPEGVPEIRQGERPNVPDAGTEAGGDGMRPVGWSRWHPVPPKGNVTWRGRVLDADGRPVEGASVYRVELDEQGARASPSSFQWVAEVAKTAADGTFEGRSVPDGSYLAAANWHARMNRPRGLDLTGAVPVRGSGADTVAGIEIRLPIAVGRLGGVRLTVLDEEGAPVRGAQVACGFERGWTDAGGRYHLSGLDPGDAEVNVSATGYATARPTITVPAGAIEDAEVRLELARKGTLEIAGRVVDEDTKPVAGVRLFLTDGSRDGARWTTSDDAGKFRFARLPDAWAKRTVDVMVSPSPGTDRILGDSTKGVRLPEPALEFVVKRLTPLRVLVRDAADGKPITLFNLDVKLERPGDTPRQMRSMSCYEEDGEVTIPVPRGRILIGVEGKGHRAMEVAVDVPGTDAPYEILIEMAAE